MASVRLGKRAARHDPRTVRLARYLTPDLPPPPAEHDWTAQGKAPLGEIGMMLNDQLGDCTCATVGHMIQVFTAANGSQVTVPDSSVLKAYRDVGGYDPADPTTDQGAVVLDVLNYWRRTGFVGPDGAAHKILGYAAVDLADREQQVAGIYYFGGLYYGAALPKLAQDQLDAGEDWHLDPDAAGGERGSWGGHAFSAHAYGRRGPGGITWGDRRPISWAWADAIVDEAYIVVTEDWAGASGSPSGLLKAQLLADLAAFG